MKKILQLIIASAFMAACYGQETKEYVEVIVTDSVHADADDIQFTLYCYSERDIAPVPYPDTVAKPQKPGISAAAQLRSIIVKNKIDTLPFVRYVIDHQEYGGNVEAIIVTRFYSRAKLESFIKMLTGIKAMEGFVSQASTSREAELKQKLIRRIMERGRADASLIAAQSGKTLGKLIQVTEKETADAPVGWTMYPPLSALYQSNFLNSYSDGRVRLTKTLVIRYGWQ